MEALDYQSIFGNWSTLLLATDDSGRLDIKKLEDEIDILVASRPCGIYSNGTACEFYSQTFDEFVKISELLSSKCESSGIPYQIGISHPCPQESVERLRAVRKLMPGAVQLILPDWFPVSDREAVTFLKTMSEEAKGIPLVLYNPPHAKRVLEPKTWSLLKTEIPSLVGLKVFDSNASGEWFEKMRHNSKGLSVFVPGHRMVTGIINGASGAYSNVACLNPVMAQKWYEMSLTDLPSALELEGRIRRFMSECIDHFITDMHYPNHACDRFMALVGGWADVGSKLRWPYDSISDFYVSDVRKKGHNIIPEFI